MFNYFIPTRILFGSGQLNNLHKQQLPGKKALIVTSAGNSVKKYGYLERLEKQLDLAGAGYVLFDKILQNPIKELVMQGAKLAGDTGCDFVIGLGGGSSIDSAKAIAIMATNQGDYWDYISGGTGSKKPVANTPLPIIAITTTAGTGTEADPWAVITNNNEKIGFGTDQTYPVLSIVDPELMLTVPKKLTAYQGFDALFHSTEGYINKFAYALSDIYALKAIELIGKYLPTAVNDGGNIEARENVALANTLSGMVESTSGCTSEHSMEHSLSAFHPNLEHGAGLIMLSREYYNFHAQKHSSDERMIAMAKALGKADAGKAEDFVTALVELQKACGVSGLKMSDYGIKQAEIPNYAKNAWKTMGALFKAEPVEMTLDDTIDIIKKSYK